MKAMILAAGIGSRMLPLTQALPKALIKIQGIPLIEHTIRYLKFYGVNDIIINIHHHAQQIIDFINSKNSFGIHIDFSDESDALLDTGGGLYKARWFFTGSDPFILTSSDVITDLDLNAMLESHKQSHSLVSLAVKKRKSTRDFLFDENYVLCGWHNNNTGEHRLIRPVINPTSLAFSTIHIINPEIFGVITERNAFSIIDAYLRLAVSQKITGFRHDQSDWLECGRYGSLEFLESAPEIRAIYEKYHK